MSTNAYRIAVIPGDGIGNEVMPEAIRVLEAVGRKHDLSFQFDEYDWSCERFAIHEEDRERFNHGSVFSIQQQHAQRMTCDK